MRKQRLRRIIGSLLAFAMVLSLFAPFSAFAAETVPQEPMEEVTQQITEAVSEQEDTEPEQEEVPDQEPVEQVTEEVTVSEPENHESEQEQEQDREPEQNEVQEPTSEPAQEQENKPEPVQDTDSAENDDTGTQPEQAEKEAAQQEQAPDVAEMPLQLEAEEELAPLLQARMLALSAGAWTISSDGSGSPFYLREGGSRYDRFTATSGSTSMPAYCLNRDKAVPRSSDTYTFPNLPTGKAYQVIRHILAAGYNNNNGAALTQMFGYTVDNEMAREATQVAIYESVLINNGTYSSVANAYNARVSMDDYASSSEYSNAFNLSKKLCQLGFDLYKADASISVATTTSSTLTSSTIKVTITPSKIYGGYNVSLSGVPSGTKITTGANIKLNGKSISKAAVSGSVTGLSGATSTSNGGNAGVFTLIVPRGASTANIKVNVSSVRKLTYTNNSDVVFAKAPSDGDKQNMVIAGGAAKVTASGSASVPQSPKGTITVKKLDAETNKALPGCVFKLQKYVSSSASYVDFKTATTNSSGVATFSGLTTDSSSLGRYRLTELTAPDGYERDSAFRFGYNIPDGYYNYTSTLTGSTGNVHPDLSKLSPVQATINGAKKNIITFAKNTTNGINATVYMYDTPIPPDTFSITMHKRDLNTGADLSGAAYQLYKANASNQWIPYQSGSVNDDGDLIFSGLHLEDSSNGKFRITETGMTNPIYQCDETFEVILDPVTGDWSYAGSCVDSQSGTFTVAGSVNADLSLSNGSSESRVIVSAAKASENDPFVFDVYQDDPPLDVFSITVNKRSLDGDMLLDGAVYQLYVTNSAGKWIQKDKKTVEDGVAVFEALDCSSSNDGRFRIIESQMSNSEYMVDGTFEAIVNPATGEWWYTSAFTGNQHGTAISGDITAKVDTKDGSTDDKVILTGSRNPQTSRYDFSIWQDDAKRTNQNLTVRKVVNMDGTEEPVSGVTFSLMHKVGTKWVSVGNLVEIDAVRFPGEYQIPATDEGWAFDMTEGDTYKVAETAAAPGILNSGWESEEFVWNPYVDLDLNFTAEDDLPTGHIGLTKVDSETNQPIKGVGFTVTAAEDIVDTVGRNSVTWYAAGETVAQVKTNDRGKILLTDLPYGKYTITETSHPDNYAYKDITFDVTIGAPDDYSANKVYTDPMIGFATYPAGMTVTTANGLRYVTVGNTPVHPEMAVAKLTERTLNPSGSAVAFDAATGRYTETKIPGTYYNGQNAKFTLTATNTGDVELFNLKLVDVMSDVIWTTVKKQTSGSRTTDVTFRQVDNTPLSLGQALAVGSTVTTSQGSTATVTEITYDDAHRTYTIIFDHLAVGDSIPLQITYSLFNYDNISKQNLPNDVYLYSQYKLNGTQGALTDTPGGGVGVCHDLDKLNVVCQGNVTLHKQDSETHPLQGVHFDLYNEQGQKVPFVPQVNGDYAATVTKSNGDWISAAESGKTTTTDLVTDSEGNIRLTALPEGSYTLVETKTVSGQQLLAEPVSIVMPYVKSGAQINVDGNVYFDGTNHLYELEYTITNTANFKLPSTGAENLMPVWSMAGFVILGITVILSRKRKYGQM